MNDVISQEIKSEGDDKRQIALHSFICIHSHHHALTCISNGSVIVAAVAAAATENT